MMNTRIIEIWCHLHSMVDGMLTISPTGTLANHKRVPVNMVNFQVEPGGSRILLSIPKYLAEGLGLWTPPMTETDAPKDVLRDTYGILPLSSMRDKDGIPLTGDRRLQKTDEAKIVKESKEESRRRAIAAENEALRQSATGVAQRFSPIGGSSGIFNRLKAIRTLHDRMKEVAKQINEIPV